MKLWSWPFGGVASGAVSDFLRDYLIVGLFGVVAFGLVATFIGLASFIRPDRPTPQKLENYESGVDPVGSGWSQSQIRYYIFALLFVRKISINTVIFWRGMLNVFLRNGAEYAESREISYCSRITVYSPMLLV